MSDSYTYDAFGNVLDHSGESTQPYTYVGNRAYPAAGFSDFYARAYDPATGRFTSEDPVKGLATLPQTLNPYIYGVNGPLAYLDPSGAFPPAAAAGLLAVPVAVVAVQAVVHGGTACAVIDPCREFAVDKAGDAYNAVRDRVAPAAPT